MAGNFAEKSESGLAVVRMTDVSAAGGAADVLGNYPQLPDPYIIAILAQL